MGQTLPVEVLKYGALGLGLTLVAYTAALLRKELTRRSPSSANQRLLITFMAFGLVLFGIGGALEILKQRTSTEFENARKAQAEVEGLKAERDAMKRTLESIARRLSSMESFLGSKYQAEVFGIEASQHKENLIYFTKMLCQDLKGSFADLKVGREARCKGD